MRIIIQFVISIIPLLGYYVILGDVNYDVPTHFNLNGEVDQMGSKNLYLLIAFIPVIIFIINEIINQLKVDEVNRIIRNKIIIGLVIFMDIIALGTMYAAQTEEFLIGNFIFVAVGLLMIVIGNVLNKLEPNYYIGIRFPATLKSERVWYKTHHRGGWLFVIYGVIIALIAVIFNQGVILLSSLIIGIIYIVIDLFVYSKKLYRLEKSK